YDHAFPEHHSGQEHLPDRLRGRRYYVPGDQGFEQRIAEYMQRLRERGEPSEEERSD
ncbi:MAG: replication-associated recombination protein A, partial [Dehalococcoidia bacterium]